MLQLYWRYRCTAFNSEPGAGVPDASRAVPCGDLVAILIAAAVTDRGVGTASTTYELDTRPDSSLEPFKRAERANKGLTGKATTTLMTQGNNTLVSFVGETAKVVKISGEVTCRKVH